MERKELEALRDLRIGGVAEIGGRRLQCRKAFADGDPCGGCAMRDMGIAMDGYPEQCAGLRFCLSGRRKDRTSVNYIELGR